jgi:hypothetical protein
MLNYYGYQRRRLVLRQRLDPLALNAHVKSILLFIRAPYAEAGVDLALR